MLNKQNLAIAALCAKSNGKYSGLESLYVHPDYTVETDGHQLIRVSTVQNNAAVESFPELPGVGKVSNQFEPFLLEAKEALEIAKWIPKNSTVPQLEYAAVASPKGKRPVIVTTDLQQNRTFRVPESEHLKRFPNWEHVVPAVEQAEIRYKFDGVLLGRVLKQVEAFNKDFNGRSVVDLSFGSPEQAVRFDAQNLDTGQSLLAVLMPLNIKKTGGLANEVYTRRVQAEALLQEMVATALAAKTDTEKIVIAEALAARGKELFPPQPKAKLTVVAKPAPQKEPPVETPPPQENKCAFCQVSGHSEQDCALKRIVQPPPESNPEPVKHGWHPKTGRPLTPTERATYGNEIRKPLPSFTERMKKAVDADAGRELIAEHTVAINELERELGLSPTVGHGGGGYSYRGFSTLTPRERSTLVKRAVAVDKERGAKLKALIEDGVSLEVPWKALYSREKAVPRERERDRAVTKPAQTQSAKAAAQSSSAGAAVAVKAALGKPQVDPAYRPATIVSLEGLGRSYQRFWKIGQRIEAKREACEPCRGSGAQDGELCAYCAGSRTQIEIKTGPDGAPVVVDSVNVRF